MSYLKIVNSFTIHLMYVRLEALGQFTQDESKIQIVSIASFSVILSGDVIVNELIGKMFLVSV